MADYITTIAIPPTLLAMIRQEAKDTGNPLVAVIRKRVWDSYKREAADLGIGPDWYNEEGLSSEPLSTL